MKETDPENVAIQLIMKETDPENVAIQLNNEGDRSWKCSHSA